MIVDALILAGGRSSRLGDSDKQKLRIAGIALLDLTLDAVRRHGARHVVVVGDETRDAVVTVREEPAFAGPVAAIATGLRALPGGADRVLVLACDMPRIETALPTLLDADLADRPKDGTIAVDRGRRQNLAFVARPERLTAAVAALPAVIDASMRDLLSSLDLLDTPVADGSTDDIDTWDDAERFGATPATTGA